ncbi:MAG: CvpA family protein [Clostridia bacterium]|nr:CvpA family protein [Clostridia bacterium]
MIFNLIIIGVIVVFLFIGFIKGFFSELLGIVGSVLSIVLAAVFCNALADFLIDKTEIFDWLKNGIASVFPSDISSIEGLNLPEFIVNLINSYLSSDDGITLAEAISTTISKLIISFASFFIILLAVKLVVLILSKVLKALADSIKVIGVTNRLLGALLGIIKGLLIVCGALYLIEIIPFEFLNGVRELVDQSVLAQFFIKYNIYVLIFAIIRI